MTNTQSDSSNDPKNSYSTSQVVAGSRTYLFNIIRNRAGKRYLSITQQGSNGSTQTGNHIVVFEQHMQKFCKAFLKTAKQVDPKLKVYDVAKIRERYPNAFKPWTVKDEQRLVANFKEGVDVVELAKLFQRGQGGIEARLKMLGLIANQKLNKAKSPLRQT